jgi:hypothetical protein
VNRIRRLGANEAVFRATNEQIEWLSADQRMFTIVCECADADCDLRLTLSADAYEAVRSDARQFVIFPDHQLVEVEDVVGGGPGYVVVRKREGPAARVAEESDPRLEDPRAQDEGGT